MSSSCKPNPYHNRTSGRTTRIIAKAVVECLEKPGEWVIIRDHYDVQSEHVHAAKTVSDILGWMGVSHTRNENKVLVGPL